MTALFQWLSTTSSVDGAYWPGNRLGGGGSASRLWISASSAAGVTSSSLATMSSIVSGPRFVAHNAFWTPPTGETEGEQEGRGPPHSRSVTDVCRHTVMHNTQQRTHTERCRNETNGGPSPQPMNGIGDGDTRHSVSEQWHCEQLHHHSNDRYSTGAAAGHAEHIPVHLHPHTHTHTP